MSLQFSRSLRSLSSDSFRVAKIGLILAMVAIITLILWFFFARVTMYENSDAIKMTENGRLLVAFPKEVLGQIRPGQAAILRLNLDPNQNPHAIPALVYSVDPQSGQAELLVMGNELPAEVAPGELQGLVSVEVAYITPVSLVMRTTGNTAVGREVPVSPQSIEE